jgi:hypothetical protein
VAGGIRANLTGPRGVPCWHPCDFGWDRTRITSSKMPRSGVGIGFSQKPADDGLCPLLLAGHSFEVAEHTHSGVGEKRGTRLLGRAAVRHHP